MNKILLSVLLLIIISSTGSAAVTIKPDLSKDVKHGSSRWPQPLAKKIYKDLLFIGHNINKPTQYRGLIRFDISRFIAKGSIKKAQLSFTICYLSGQQKSRSFEVSHFTVERHHLTMHDLKFPSVSKVCEFSTQKVPGKTRPKPMFIKLDITKEINKDLSQGFGAVTFRLRDIMAEKNGNPERKACGISIAVKSIKLTVEP